MKFSCEKLLLQNAVNTASRAVAAKSSIPALEGLLLTCGGESLTVSGYNMQTGIRTKFAAEVEESGELVVNARLIGEILRRLPDDVVTFTANDNFDPPDLRRRGFSTSWASPPPISPSCPRSRRSTPSRSPKRRSRP